MIPQLLLEEILLGEKAENDYYDKYGKEDIQSALADLRKSNEEILAAYPADVMEDDFIKKSFAEKNRHLSSVSSSSASSSDSSSTGKKRYSLAFRYSAAALLLFALATPLVIKNINSVSNHANVVESGDSASSYIGIKGTSHHQIRLYKQKGNNALLLEDGDLAKENDLIQITYTPGVYNFGVIFSVDGNGNVTRHFPENSWEAAKLEKTGEEVPLSFSYALDDAPDYECFVFVASKKAFDLSKMEKISSRKYSIDFLKKGSYLPKDCDSSVFILNKK
ncbi:MAG: hypothetical protein J5817_04930 [Treponema sp.]|nr:hypothetical protein [Treponema sp.]